MTNATPTPLKAPLGNTPTNSPNMQVARHQAILRERVAHQPTPKVDPLARQQAIENALSMALFHVRNGDTLQAIHTATAKAIRAASMLKQACAESAIGGWV